MTSTTVRGKEKTGAGTVVLVGERLKMSMYMQIALYSTRVRKCSRERERRAVVPLEPKEKKMTSKKKANGLRNDGGDFPQG